MLDDKDVFVGGVDSWYEWSKQNLEIHKINIEAILANHLSPKATKATILLRVYRYLHNHALSIDNNLRVYQNA